MLCGSLEFLPPIFPTSSSVTGFFAGNPTRSAWWSFLALWLHPTGFSVGQVGDLANGFMFMPLKNVDKFVVIYLHQEIMQGPVLQTFLSVVCPHHFYTVKYSNYIFARKPTAESYAQDTPSPWLEQCLSACRWQQIPCGNPLSHLEGVCASKASPGSIQLHTKPVPNNSNLLTLPGSETSSLLSILLSRGKQSWHDLCWAWSVLLLEHTDSRSHSSHATASAVQGQLPAPLILIFSTYWEVAPIRAAAWGRHSFHFLWPRSLQKFGEKEIMRSGEGWLTPFSQEGRREQSENPAPQSCAVPLTSSPVNNRSVGSLLPPPSPLVPAISGVRKGGNGPWSCPCVLVLGRIGECCSCPQA